MAESAEVSVHEVDCTDSISLHNKLSVFLFIGSFSMQSFQFINGLNLISHNICCVHSTRRSRWSFVLRNDKIKIWNTNGQNVIAWILKRHFKDFPNSISSPLWWKETQFCWQAWSHLREAFYHKDYSISDGIQKISCKYFLFGEKEWPSLRTTLHVWSKGDILDLSSWEAQCTTAASYIFAK